MTLGQKGVCWLFIHPKLLKYETYRTEVLKFVSSVRQNQTVGWSKVVFVAVEVSPAGSKPPAAIGESISKGERHDLGAAAPFSTKTSSLQGRARGSAFTSKLVEVIFGPGSTWLAEKLSPCIACNTVATPSVRSRFFVSASPSASLVRRGCRASCSRLVNADPSFSSHPKTCPCSCPHFFEEFFNHSICIRQRGLAKPGFFLLGGGVIAHRDSIALLPWHLRVTSMSRNYFH